MYTCTHCSVQSRRLENSGKLPKNCPMRFHPEVTDTPQPEYFLPENHEFYVRASELKAAGYGSVPAFGKWWSFVAPWDTGRSASPLVRDCIVKPALPQTFSAKTDWKSSQSCAKPAMFLSLPPELKSGLAGRRPLNQCAAPFCRPSFSTNSVRI